MAASMYDDNDPLTRALLSLKSAITASASSGAGASSATSAVASSAALDPQAVDHEETAATASRRHLNSQLLSSGRMKQTGRAATGGRGEVRASDLLGMKKFSGHMLWLRVQKARLTAGGGGGGGGEMSGGVGDFGSGDFEQQVDKRKLQQLWQYLPEKEKRQWNAKAARLMRQAARIGERSFGGANSTALSPRQLADHRVDEAVRRLASERRRLQLQMEKGKLGRFTALDVAAHLKLLGDSLQALGLRLQRASTVTQAGSLAVISDSLLCSLVCLHCLATQVPGIAEAVDVAEAADSLDNCAFFMPGLAGQSA